MNAYAPRPGGDGARPPPRNVEAEQALLGAILVNNDAHARVSGFLQPGHFVEDVHRRIYEVADKLIRAGSVANPITMRHHLGDHDLGGITVFGYLVQLASEATTIINAADYGRIVVDLAARRRLIELGQEIVDVAHDAPVGHGPERIVEAAESAFMQMRATDLAHVRTTRIEAGVAAADLLAEVDKIRSGEAKDEGVRTGWPSIDMDTGGLRQSDLWVLGARAAMGKSAVASALAINAARTGAGVLFCPFEIGQRQASARLLAALAYSSRSSISYAQVMRGEVDDEARQRLGEAAQRLASMPLVLDVTDSATLPQITARVRAERDRMARRGVQLKVAIFDYIAFINASDKYKGQRPNEIGEISVGLKQLAKSLNICCVLLAQVNRQTENREDKRPTISDLRDSGNLEQDADVVALLYRESYYVERSTAFQRGDADAIVKANDARNEIEIILGKNRTGATRSHKLWCEMSASLVSAQARGGL